MSSHLRTGQHKLAFTFTATAVVLVLLYAWALTESVPLAVMVRGDRCTAELADRQSEIICPGLSGGSMGVYLTRTPLAGRLSLRSVDRLSPAAAWESVRLRVPSNSNLVTKLLAEQSGRLRNAPEAGTAVTWSIPNATDYRFEARVRRPDGEHAGILLLEPDNDDGWLFLVDSENRQATWWRWQDGKPSSPIVGIPFQKPLLAQGQTLLRHLLVTVLGALAVALSAALLQQLLKRTIHRLKGSTPLELAENSSWVRLVFGSYLVLLPILLGIFGLTIWIAIDALERVPHVQDSITYLFQAQTLARGALWSPAPHFPDAFEQEFLITHNGKWFGQYPPGYPALLAVGVLVGQPWLVNPLLAVMTAALLFTLGKSLYETANGLLASFLAALSPFFIFLSGSLMVHTAELFWTALVMTSWTLAMRRPYRLRWAWLTGAALGMLLLTRQITAAAIGASFVMLMLATELAAWLHSETPRRQPAPGKQAAGLLAVLPFIFLQFGYQAALTGSLWQDPRLLGRPFDRPGFGADIGESENAFRLAYFEEGLSVTWYTDSDQPPRGHSLARGLYNTEENWGALTTHLFGWHPFVALAFCWLPFLLRRSTRSDWILLIVLFAVLGIYVTYWTTGLMYGPRYYFAALPALLLLTASGLRALAARFGRVTTALVLAVVAFAALVSYWPDAVASLHGYNFVSGQDRVLVEEQIEGQALVFVPVQNWWDYGRFFSGNTPWLDGRIVYARDLGEVQNSRLQEQYPEKAAYFWQDESKTLTDLTTLTDESGIEQPEN